MKGKTLRDKCPLVTACHNVGPGQYKIKTPEENNGVCIESKYKSYTSAKMSNSQFIRQPVNMSHLRSSVQESCFLEQSK
ncbi:hypothetical protein FGO68_gene14268 [Halteria grandinella]|uniref:Uncharacterized protein n=1 Tax=Halteria grandinella TaxID=5974 RepID=A0A8J8NL56_HALGN|nr:hypothetical protein FGO68_gene14268 [Halteria grandinella]